MKLKLDEAGHAVLQDGRPIYVHDDGKEVPFDAPATIATIARLNGEAKGHREAKEKAEGALKNFAGIEDAEAARKALETVRNLDDGKLIQAGKVDEIKAAAKKAAEEQVAAANKTNAEALKAATERADALERQLYAEKIGGSFMRSKFVGDKVAIPADMLQARFGTNFKVEEGKTVAYDQAGNKVYSRAKPGEVADFDEALEMLIDAYPYRNEILKGSGHRGDGAQGNRASNGGGAKTISRDEFAKLDPAAQMKAMRVDKLTVVDA